MPASYPRIPYGWADFRAIRLENRLYVDKTRFVSSLEEERYAFLIRPRRMGKSCWVSLLENYYDRRGADEFEAVLGGTHLGRQPTENRHRYIVLRFDFSTFDDTLETLQERFETYCHLELNHALRRNRDLFPQEARQHILSPPSIDAKLAALFLYSALCAHRRVRQLCQRGAGLSRRSGLSVVHPRRRLLPQFLRHLEGRSRAKPRRPRAAVHHRGIAAHHGRRHQRLQPRQEHYVVDQQGNVIRTLQR